MSDADTPTLPKIAGAPLSVILLPGSNDNAAEVVGAWRTVLDSLDREFEILVSETSGQAPEEAGHVRILRDTAGKGPGAVLRAALAAARHPLICCAPCDRQYEPADLKRLLEKIDAVHVVTGIRTGRPAPLLLRLTGAFYRLIVRVLFGVPLEPRPGWLGWRHRLEHLVYRVLFGISNYDVTCPFRVIRRDIFTHIPLQSDGPFVHVELLAKGRFLGSYYMDEVPVAWQPPAAPQRFRAMLPDLRRVFRHPEFRPAK